ncbi:hydrophobic protein LTI6B [Phalaenopsis equestris]|uniref:hydrophobic protein LTI6B n=1 Tax=Phalaenopsis equestris TaxID=78828 RepID=UPI0009E2647B|nr:hydrophobic protein LTI6B [Phalaenopsis equestris]
MRLAFSYSSSSTLRFSLSSLQILISVKMSEGTANCIDILLAIILPPLGVFLKFGCKAEFWICLLLTILGYIPGIIYAIYAITK